MLPRNVESRKRAMPVVNPLEKGFRNPPDSVKPSIYWYWMSGNVSPEGVVKDIEAMHKIGIGVTFIGNIGYPAEKALMVRLPCFQNNGGWP